MKKLIAIAVILCFMCVGCGSVKQIDEYTYDTYGIINQDQKMNPDIEYKLIIGNVIWSILLVETIIAPVYFIGFSIYEPIGKKSDVPIGVVID